MKTISINKPIADAASASKSPLRLASIDILRGIIIVLMLLDHVRERFYYHHPLTDPMLINNTEPELFFSRVLAHFCPPIFIFLTGISAWLYAHPSSGITRSASAFLFKRGLFLIAIELTLVNFSWFGNYQTLYLQVIWAIGLSMIALSILCKLPRAGIITLGLSIVFAHNLLSPISFTAKEFGFTAWTILHDANFLISEGAFKLKVSYPVLPWIGVILLGFAIGPIFGGEVKSKKRTRLLSYLGLSALALLLVLRGFNIYGETLAWQPYETTQQSIMSFFNLSKYPPSLAYLLLTIGGGLLMLSALERTKSTITKPFQVLGSAPMFFYILHLYVLLFAYKMAVMTFGTNQGELFGLNAVWQIWLLTALLATILYFPTKAFAHYKRSSNKKWLKYF